MFDKQKNVFFQNITALLITSHGASPTLSAVKIVRNSAGSSFVSRLTNARPAGTSSRMRSASSAMVAMNSAHAFTPRPSPATSWRPSSAGRMP